MNMCNDKNGLPHRACKRLTLLYNVYDHSVQCNDTEFSFTFFGQYMYIYSESYNGERIAKTKVCKISQTALEALLL